MRTKESAPWSWRLIAQNGIDCIRVIFTAILHHSKHLNCIDANFIAKRWRSRSEGRFACTKYKLNSSRMRVGIWRERRGEAYKVWARSQYSLGERWWWWWYLQLVSAMLMSWIHCTWHLNRRYMGRIMAWKLGRCSDVWKRLNVWHTEDGFRWGKDWTEGRNYCQS